MSDKSMPTEFWLISAPGETSKQHTFDSLNNLTSGKGQKLSTNYKFHIPPDLKVGTLDQLVGLSDDLSKLDTYAEGVTKKLAMALRDLHQDDKSIKSSEPVLLAGNVRLDQYVTKFNWDAAKYPTKQSLKTIADIISKSLTQIDADLKAKQSAYNSSKTSLESLEKKSSGSLLTRNLGDIVKKENFVLGSEYLTTAVVVVPKNLFKEWYSSYEKLSNEVVPRSSFLIHEDNENGLFTVTLFQKALEDFKREAKKKKFTVRDFVFDEARLSGAKDERVKLEADLKKQYSLLLRWLRVNFSEAFAAWIHVKALRLFVESVLRYGLPVNFQPMLLEPNKKSIRKLREVLNQHYAHLDTSLAQGPMDEIPGLNLQQEYYPYVYFKISLDFDKPSS